MQGIDPFTHHCWNMNAPSCIQWSNLFDYTGIEHIGEDSTEALPHSISATIEQQENKHPICGTKEKIISIHGLGEKILEYYDELKKPVDFCKICFIKVFYFLSLFLVPFLYN